jgi:hypothetical protein
MTFEYVWGFLQTQGHPPTDAKLHTRIDYKLYPFSHHGSIITYDLATWDLPQSESRTDGTLKFKDWPSTDEIIHFVTIQPDSETWFLIALSDQPMASTIDPTASVPLSKIPAFSQDSFLPKFSVLGFDVIDKSGLSSLTNVGYTAQELSALADIIIHINEYGLIKTASDSYKFAQFASHAAAEHAPFFPIEVRAYHHQAQGQGPARS